MDMMLIYSCRNKYVPHHHARPPKAPYSPQLGVYYICLHIMILPNIVPSIERHGRHTTTFWVETSAIVGALYHDRQYGSPIWI